MKSPQFFVKKFDQLDFELSGQVTGEELREFLSEYRDEIPKTAKKTLSKLCKQSTVNKEQFCQAFKRSRIDKITSRYVNYVVPAVEVKKIKTRSLAYSEVDGVDKEEYSCWPPPLCLLSLSIVQIVLFFVDKETRTDNRVGSGIVEQYMILRIDKLIEFWRYFTYMFVHNGYTHLSLNLIVQIVCGFPLEMVHGWWRILLIYVFGVFGGALGSVIFESNSLIGASAGVFAMMTAHIACVLINFSDMKYMCHAYAFALYVFIELFVADTFETTSYWAHFFGSLYGLLTGIVVLKNFVLYRHEKFIIGCAWIILLSITVTGIVFNLNKALHFF